MRQRVGGVVDGEATAVMGENIAAGGGAIYPGLAGKPGSIGEEKAPAAVEAPVHDIVYGGSDRIGLAGEREAGAVWGKVAWYQQTRFRAHQLPGQVVRRLGC